MRCVLVPSTPNAAPVSEAGRNGVDHQDPSWFGSRFVLAKRPLDSEPEAVLGSLARQRIDSTLDVYALVELPVEPYQHEAQQGGGQDGQERCAAVDRHGDHVPRPHVVQVHVAGVDW